MEGKELKKLRKRLKYSVKGFAKKIGILRTSLSRYENGERKITPEMEEKILQAIGFWGNGEKRVDLEVKVDYLRLTFFQAKIDWVIEEVLMIPKNYFLMEEKPESKSYDYLYTFGYIRISHDSKGDKGTLLELSSSGLVQFEEHLESYDTNLQGWLRKVFNDDWYRANNYYTRVHSSRLDIAIDEMYNPIEGNLDLRKLKEKREQQLFWSDLKVYGETLSGKKSLEENPTENDALTLTFGGRGRNGSDGVYIRFYEKRHELAKKEKKSVETILFEYGVWNRYEMELGKNVNQEIISRWINGERLEFLAIDLMLSKIHFYEYVEGHFGKDLEFFREFHEMFGKYRRFAYKSPSKKTLLEKSFQWIEYQVAPTLRIISEVFGKEFLHEWLDWCIDKVELTPEQDNKIQAEKYLAENNNNTAYLYYQNQMSNLEFDSENGLWQVREEERK